MKKILLVVTALMMWAGAMAQVPRAEYPRPQFERAEWVNLKRNYKVSVQMVENKD